MAERSRSSQSHGSAADRREGGLPPRAWDLLWWVFGDAWQSFKWRIAGVAALNLIGTAAGVATVAGIVLYARTLESGSAVAVAGIELSLPSSAGGVLLLSAVLAAFGMASALCVYGANWLAGRLSVAYLRRCMARALTIAADPQYIGWAAAAPCGRRIDSMLLDLAGRHSRATAVIFRKLLLMILPLIVFLVAGVCLVIVSPLLTMILVPLALMYVAPLRLITRSVVHHQNELIKSSRAARQVIRKALERQHRGACTLAAVHRCLNSPEVRQADERLFRRRLAGDRMQLTNTAFFIGCVFVLFAYFALRAIEHGHSWSELLLYVLALRFAVTELRRVTASVVLTNRYVPHARTYREFIDACEQWRITRARNREAHQALPDELAIPLPQSRGLKGESNLRLRRGQILLVITDERPHSQHLQTLAAVLESWCSLPVNFASDHMEAHQADIVRDASAHESVHAASGPPSGSTAGALLAVTAPIEARQHSNAMVLMSLAALRRIACAAAVGPAESGLAGEYIIVAARDARAAMHPDLAPLRERMAGAVVVAQRQVIGGGDMTWLLHHADDVRSELTRSGARQLTHDPEADLHQDDESDADEV